MPEERPAMKPRKPEYMGEHGAGSIIAKSGKYGAPMLEDNAKDGRNLFPPYIVAVGDRRRAADPARSTTTAAQFLSFFVDMPEAAWHACRNTGRTNILVGIFEHEGKPLPVGIFETQMGMSGEEINLEEAMCLADPTGYNIRNGKMTRIHADGLTIIRVGSCGGLNTDYGEAAEPPVLKIGDLVVADSTFGHSGAIYQRLGGLDYMDPEALALARMEWKALGLGMLGNFLYGECSPEVISSLMDAARHYGQTAYVGRNFSKDSLRGEHTSLPDFMKLAKVDKAKSTEMEQLWIAFIARYFWVHYGIRVRHGLASAVVGALPEHSFYTNDEEKSRAENAESMAMKVALLAMWKLHYEGKRGQ